MVERNGTQPVKTLFSDDVSLGSGGAFQRLKKKKKILDDVIRVVIFFSAPGLETTN